MVIGFPSRDRPPCSLISCWLNDHGQETSAIRLPNQKHPGFVSLVGDDEVSIGEHLFDLDVRNPVPCDVFDVVIIPFESVYSPAHRGSCYTLYDTV